MPVTTRRRSGKSSAPKPARRSAGKPARRSGGKAPKPAPSRPAPSRPAPSRPAPSRTAPSPKSPSTHKPLMAAKEPIDFTYRELERRAQNEGWGADTSYSARPVAPPSRSYLDDLDEEFTPSFSQQKRKVRELRPCEDDAQLNGLISSLDILKAFGNDPDNAKATLKVAGVPQSEIDRIAREKGVMGIIQRVKEAYESCDIKDHNKDTVNRVLAEISEQNIKVIKSAQELKAAREAATPEARARFDKTLLDEYTMKPQRDALKISLATIEANLAKTKRIREQAKTATEFDEARLSLYDEKDRLETASMGLAGSFEDYERMSKVSEIIDILEKKREEHLNDLLEEQYRAKAETMFLENDQKKLRERVGKIYADDSGKSGEVPMFDIPRTEKSGKRLGILKRGDTMTDMERQLKLMKDTWENHKYQTNQCRVLLSRHGIDSQKKWETLMGKVVQHEDTRIKFAPCLESAMWAYTMSMYEKTGEFLDNNGVVEKGKFDKGYNDPEFKKTFDNAHPYLPKYTSVVEDEQQVQEMLKEYLNFVMANQAGQPIPPKVKEYLHYSKYGTGFQLDGGIFAPAPMVRMIKTLVSGSDKEKEALISKDGLGGIYDRLKHRTGHEDAYDALSAQAKTVLHTRSAIKKRIKLKLGEVEHTECPINRFIGKYIESDTNGDVVGTYPFMEEANMWAKLEMGVPSSSTAKKIFKSLVSAFEVVVNETERDYGKPLKDEPNNVIWTLFELFDIILATDVDCDALSSSKLSKDDRQSMFESYMLDGDKVYQNAAKMMQKLGCRVSAVTFDRAMQGPLADVQEEILPFAPIPLVDELLLRLGLPTVQSRNSALNSEIDTIAMLKLDEDSHFDELVKLVKKALAKKFSPGRDLTIPEYHSIMSNIINASLLLRDFKYSFELAKEPTTDEIWELLKQGRYLFKLNKDLLPQINGVDVVLTDISDLRKRQANPNEVSAVVAAVKMFFTDGYNEVLKTTSVSEGVFDGTIVPVTAFETFMEGYSADGGGASGNLVLVLPETITAAFMDTIASRSPESFRVVTTIDADKQTLIFKEMTEYAMQIMSFDNVFKKGVSEPSILRKQLRMIKKQAETLCNLPESECKSSKQCVFAKGVKGKGVCIVRGRQEIVKKNDQDVAQWIRPDRQFSKTKVLIHAAESGKNHDLVQIGWDSLQDSLMDPSNEAKMLYRGIKAADYLLDYADTLYVGGVPARREKDNNKIIFNTFDALVTSAKRQIEFMERLRMDPDTLCRGIHKAIKQINDFVHEIEKRGDKDWDVEATHKSMAETMKKFTNLFLIDPTYKGKKEYHVSEEDEFLAIPPPLVKAILCRLIHAIYTLNNQIRSINCNLNAEECKTNSKSGGMCVWRSETCMNPAIHKLKAYSSTAGAFGIVHRVLIPEFRSMLMGSKGPDGYGPDDIPAVERILSALFGDEITSLKYMNKFEREQKLEQLVEYSSSKLPSPYNPDLYRTAEPEILVDFI